MAYIKQGLIHSVNEAQELSINIPDSISRNGTRCAEAGDVFAEKIYGKDGDYANLIKAFTRVAKRCEKALKNETKKSSLRTMFEAFISEDTKPNLQQTMRKATLEAAELKRQMNEFKYAYNMTADIVNNNRGE